MFLKIKEIKGHSGAIYCSDYFENFLYTGSADKYVTRWNLSLGIQDNFAIRFEFPVYSLKITSNNHLIVGLSSGAIHIFDLENKIEVKHFTQHIKSIFSIELNNSKNHFYCGDADGNLSIWNSESFELLLYLPLNCGKIRKISSSNNGEFIVLSCQDGTVRIFETNGYNEISTIEAHKNGATVAVFHPMNETLLISGGKDALLKIWSWKNTELLKEIPAHNYVIYDLLFLENNELMISASRDKTLKIWNTQQFDFVQRLDVKNGGHKHSINYLSMVNDSTFSSVSDDKKIIVWKNETTSLS